MRPGVSAMIITFFLSREIVSVGFSAAALADGGSLYAPGKPQDSWRAPRLSVQSG